ncbi:MAG TPA: PhnD/SsuA/transferrin family substrate-binding protein [Myxococcota bacterium]|nr:PhnD/SsuA/transferrin family substrate-binding protein [Myxococcota bacterium]
MLRRPALACLLLIGAVTLPAAASASPRQVLLYDPDANLSDIVEIAAAFSRYLQRTGENWTFQAVQRRDTFEALLKEPGSEYAIVSAAYLRTAAEANMTPLLVPADHGDVYYRKQLVTAAKVDARALSGRNIAVSGAGDERSAETQAVLADLARAGVAKPLLVSLPKDIDALMALYFGQVDAALVVPHSIEVMRRISPKAVASLEVLHETRKMLRSPLCVVGKISGDKQKEPLVQYLQGMAADPDGKEIMRRMAFDAWMPFQSDMLR